MLNVTALKLEALLLVLWFSAQLSDQFAFFHGDVYVKKIRFDGEYRREKEIESWAELTRL